MQLSPSINTRLWLTYSLLIFLILIVALAGILFAFEKSPLLYRQIFLRIDLVSNLLSGRLSLALETNWNPTIQSFFVEAEVLDVQVAILDGDGNVVLIGNEDKNFHPQSIDNPADLSKESLEHILVYQDENRNDWFYQVRQINQDYYLLATATRPDIPLSAILQDELVKPMIRTGFYALIVAFFLSWFIAKWITRPLKMISESAQNIAVGKYEAVPIEGPLEVQQLSMVINDMSQKVENSLQSQREFVANVSHEFKTPLTSIQGFSQAIQDGTVHTKKDITHAASVIINETDRLNLLVNDLLMLAKLDAGTMIMTKVDIDLNDILQNVIDHFFFELEKSGINLRTGFSPQTIHLKADGTRLAQVFTNLLDNAIKFSNPGSDVEVSTEIEDSFAFVTIKDNGIGISERSLKRIFERFFQVEKSRSRGKGYSVGLGLAIANQIVKAHGGEILVQSKVGVGSTFMVKLPIEDADKIESTS